MLDLMPANRDESGPVLCLSFGGDCVEGDAAAADLGEDLVGGGCLDEWLGSLLVVSR